MSVAATLGKRFPHSTATGSTPTSASDTVLHGEDVVSGAYAGYVAEGRVEVIVGTAEPYRGQGLASIAAALLAEEARRRRHKLTWSCITENVGSMKVARRLAFRTERPYRTVCI